MNKLNKFFALTLVLVLLSACIVKKKTSNNNPNTIIIDETTNNTTTNNTTTKPVVEKIDTQKVLEPDTTIIIEPILKLRGEYNIAIILPLQADSIQSSWNSNIKTDLEDFEIPKISHQALSFLEGAIMALEEQKLGTRLNIKVYDNEYSYSKTQQVLSRLAADDIDFIFGPIKKQNIQLVSNYAKQNDIIMISPFSPSKMASSNYSKYIMATPSLDIHFYTITKYIADSLSNSNIKILYPNTLGGKNHAFALQAMFASINDSLALGNKIKYALIEVEEKTNDRRTFEIANYLDTDKQNTVIVTSFNEGFVHSMLTSLNLALKNFDITVFGMPNWKESKTLRLDYFNNLNVHYTDSEWIDANDKKTIAFKKNFRAKYETIPIFEAYLAYDLFSFFPNLIEKYGLSLDEKIQQETYEGILNKYHFQPLYIDMDSKDMQSDRIENTNLHIISYKKYKLNLEQ